MLVTLAIQDSGHSDQVKALHDKNEEDGKDEGLFDLTYSNISDQLHILNSYHSHGS